MEKMILCFYTPRAGKWNHRYILPTDATWSDSALSTALTLLKEAETGSKSTLEKKLVTQKKSVVEIPGYAHSESAFQENGRVGLETIFLYHLYYSQLSDQEKRECQRILDEWFAQKRNILLATVDWETEGISSVIPRPELDVLGKQLSEIEEKLIEKGRKMPLRKRNRLRLGTMIVILLLGCVIGVGAQYRKDMQKIEDSADSQMKNATSSSNSSGSGNLENVSQKKGTKIPNLIEREQLYPFFGEKEACDDDTLLKNLQLTCNYAGLEKDKEKRKSLDSYEAQYKSSGLFVTRREIEVSPRVEGYLISDELETFIKDTESGKIPILGPLPERLIDAEMNNDSDMDVKKYSNADVKKYFTGIDPEKFHITVEKFIDFVTFVKRHENQFLKFPKELLNATLLSATDGNLDKEKGEMVTLSEIQEMKCHFFFANPYNREDAGFSDLYYAGMMYHFLKDGCTIYNDERGREITDKPTRDKLKLPEMTLADAVTIFLNEVKMKKIIKSGGYSKNPEINTRLEEFINACEEMIKESPSIPKK
ncbi:MAG: hypothetical protein Q4C70_04575 [Planctomycetia bacterium]|nr:hypothetical protein [Planctomycetia bacterium]